MSDLILTVRDMEAGYGGEPINRNVSIDVGRGKIVAVIGPNGCGKSTLMKAIYGLVPERRGEVLLRDSNAGVHDLSALKAHQITECGVNYVPQIQNVFPEMSVRENLEIGSIRKRQDFDARLETVLALLPKVAGFLRQRASTLSGGQRQMLALGRALMSNPALLILDEPSAGLAPAVQDEVFSKLTEINAAGVSILMVEQRARQALAIAHYGYVLEQGRNRLEGPAGDLLKDEEVIRLYLGSAMRARRA